MIRCRIRFIGLAFCLVLTAPSALFAQPSYTEDFTSTAYRDAANTTVDWDTTAGELRPFPFVPSLVGTWNSPVDARGVAIAGDLALLADGPGGLYLLDITDPANPLPIGVYDTPGIALDVAIDGDLAIVADDAGGLVLVDITNPAAPALLGTFATGDRARSVAIAGDLAYVAGGSAGLEVVDISAPTAPVAVGAYDTPGFASGVAVAGNRACVADGFSGLMVVDITNPALPALLGSYDTPGYANNVALSGTWAYLADGSTGLIPVDISDPSAPLPGTALGTAGSATGVAVTGDLACVTIGAAGLMVADITNPAAPVLAVAYDTAGYSYGVAVAGELALVADGANGLAVVAAAMVVEPALTGASDTGREFHRVAVTGNLAVMADISGIVEVFEITDPYAPAPIGAVTMPDTPNGLLIDGNLVFVAAMTSGLQIVDIDDPANPVIVGSYNTQGEAHDVAVAGNFAFVADNGVGMQVIDITDPTNPTIAAIHFTTGQSYGIAVAGDHAYLADGSDGLKVIDISNPQSPIAAGTYPIQDSAQKVTVTGDLAFVTYFKIVGGSQDVLIVDVSDPSNPTFVAEINVSFAGSTTVSGNLMFIADLSGTTRVIDISDPANPFWVGNVGWGTSYDARDAAVSGEHVFVADGASGLLVAQVYQHRLAMPTGNVARSLQVNGSTAAITRARLTSEPANSVVWELTAAGGTGWTAAADGEWAELAEPGAALRWRSTHDWSPGAQLTVTGVTVEWLYEPAIITSVTDIANDQGRQVSLEWRRSGHDFLGDASQIAEYAVYRRIDPLKTGELPSADIAGASAAVLDHAQAAKAAGWHFLTTVPVRVEDDYAVVVPTLADSTIASGHHFSTFMVSAMTATPGIFYDSAPDSGYSVDNLAPGVPMAITAAYAADAVALDWADAPEADFRYYRVYRGTTPGFVPGPGNLVQEVGTSAWTDPTGAPWGYHYQITAVDFSGNEGEPGAPVNVSGTVVPSAFTALGEAVPNPFNPSTRLSFTMAAAGHARLRVYDATGRFVATLVDERRSAGDQSVVWGGRDAAGRAVASGVYLYRLEAGAFNSTRKMVLMK